MLKLLCCHASSAHGVPRSPLMLPSAALRQVIKRTKNTVDQQWIQTSDGQRLQWPPKALQETLGPAASAALAAIPGMPSLGPPQQAGAAKN